MNKLNNIWNRFAEKHPSASKWIREGGLFVIVSNLITVLKYVMLLLVFLLISTHFTATLGIPIAPPTLKIYSFKCSSWVEPMDFTSDLQTRLHALYTQ